MAPATSQPGYQWRGPNERWFNHEHTLSPRTNTDEPFALGNVPPSIAVRRGQKPRGQNGSGAYSHCHCAWLHGGATVYRQQVGRLPRHAQDKRAPQASLAPLPSVTVSWLMGVPVTTSLAPLPSVMVLPPPYVP